MIVSSDTTVPILALPAQRWYAVKVRSGAEFTTTAALRHKGITTFCPAYSEMRRYTNRSKKIEKAAFPGYIFCNFDLQDKVKILSSIGVSYIVGAGGVPVPVPESELSNTRRTIEAGGTPAPYLKVGQLVLVETGPLAGVEGVLMREAGRDRLVVSVHLLQRSIAINIARDDVRVIQPSLLKVGA